MQVSLYRNLSNTEKHWNLHVNLHPGTWYVLHVWSFVALVTGEDDQWSTLQYERARGSSRVGDVYDYIWPVVLSVYHKKRRCPCFLFSAWNLLTRRICQHSYEPAGGVEKLDWKQGAWPCPSVPLTVCLENHEVIDWNRRCFHSLSTKRF